MKRIFMTGSALLASVAPALADAGFSDDWSFQSSVILGLAFGMPIFLPSALLISVGVATGRAVVRKRKQRPSARFCSTCLLTSAACAVLYVLGMIMYLLLAELISRM